MAENINLIPANELPVAEGDEVSVLCLENGELKQKAASGLGGGDNYDAVIKVEEWYNEVEDNSGVTFTLESGSYEGLAEIINSGKPPKVLLHGNLYYGGEYPYAEVLNCGVVEPGQINLKRMCCWVDDQLLMYVHPDGTVDRNWMGE